MCESNIYDQHMNPVKVSYEEKHILTYTNNKGEETILAKDLILHLMEYNHIKIKKIKNYEGFKTGYIFIFGEV